MILISIYILLFLIWGLLTKIRFGKVLKVNMLYTGMWCFGGILTNTGYVDLFKPSISTHRYIIISIVVFNLCYLLIGSRSDTNVYSGYALNIPKYKLRVIYIFNVLSYIFMAPITWKAIKILLSDGWFQIRYYAYEGSTALASALQLRVYTWIINPIFTVTVLFAAILAFTKAKNKALIVISIINISIITVTFGGRYNFVRAVAYYILAFSIMKSSRIEKIRIKKRYIALFTVFLILLIYLTSLRSIKGLGFIENALVYFFGSIVFFDVITNEPLYKIAFSTPLYGRGIFGFLVNPVLYLVYVFFGGSNLTSEYLVKTVSDNFQYIGMNTRYNAFATSLYIFWRDGGVWGIVFGTIVLVLIYKYYVGKSIKLNTLRYHAMRIYLLYIIATSTLSYGLLTIQSFVMIVFIYLFSTNLKLPKSEVVFIKQKS